MVMRAEYMSQTIVVYILGESTAFLHASYHLCTSWRSSRSVLAGYDRHVVDAFDFDPLVQLFQI